MLCLIIFYVQKVEKEEFLKLYDENPEKAFLKVYKIFRPMSISVCGKYNMSESDADDILQDSVIGLLEMMRKQEFTLEHKLSTLMFTIIKNQTTKRIRRISRIDEESPLPDVETNEETENDRIIKIKDAIKKLGKTCQKILTYTGFYGYKAKEIMLLTGLSSEQTVRVRKHKCMKELKELVL